MDRGRELGYRVPRKRGAVKPKLLPGQDGGFLETSSESAQLLPIATGGFGIARKREVKRSKTFFGRRCREVFMQYFAIIELEDGLTIVEVKPHQTPEDVAVRAGGTLVDPGPYASYDEAVDALADLEADEEEE
jgi:hypothetical protein